MTPALRARPRQRRRAQQLRVQGGLGGERLAQPEIEDLDLALWGHLDVRRLEVAVDDAVRVRVLEGLGHLAREHRASARGIAPGQPLRERGPLDGSSPGRAGPRLLLAVEDGDVRMMDEARSLPRARSGPGARCRSRRPRHQLEGHVAPQADIAGPPDLAHPPGAEPGDDLEGTEASSGSEAIAKRFPHLPARPPPTRKSIRPKDCRAPTDLESLRGRNLPGRAVSKQ